MNRNTELANYTRELAFLLKKGISPADAIKNTYVNIRDKRLKDLFSKVVIALGYGAPLSRALAETPGIYPVYVIKLINQAEAKEEIPQTLIEIADNLETEEQLSLNVKTLFRYPVMPANIILFVAVFIFRLISPTITTLFRGNHVQLPITTKAMMAIDALFHNTYFLTAYFFVIIAANALFYMKEVTKNEILFSMPITGKILKKYYACRTAIWTSAMLDAGIRLEDIFTSLAEGIDFKPVKKNLESAAADISTGKGFSAVMASLSSFPEIFKWFSKKYSGKGDVKNCMDSCARFIRSDITENWNVEGKAAITTFMLVFLGISLIVTLSIFLPLYQLIGQIG